MDEHDDDLASRVEQDIAEETDAFPVTEEELEDDTADDVEGDSDQDDSEL